MLNAKTFTVKLKDLHSGAFAATLLTNKAFLLPVINCCSSSNFRLSFKLGWVGHVKKFGRNFS